MLSAITAVAVSGVIAMSVVAAGAAIDPSMLAVLGVVAAAVVLPGALRRRTSYRRGLHRRVGDPASVSGGWRRALASAWTARDRYAEAAADDGSSPLWERLADHQPAIDAALERCGALARDGDLLAHQLQGFRPRRLRRDLRVARRRDPRGRRAHALAGRLAEVERLEACVHSVQARLDAAVHDLRTAAWRATELRAHRVAEHDGALGDLVADLVHLRDALDELDAPPQALTDVDTTHVAVDLTASPAGRRYDV